MVDGLLRFDADFKLKMESKKTGTKKISDKLLCPKCKKGTIIKGKMAYGCSAFKTGCDFKVLFEVIRTKMKGQKPTKELVYSIINGII